MIERNRMSFFKLLLKAIKELTPPLNKNRMPSFYNKLRWTDKDRIFYVLRGVLFFTGIFMGFIYLWLHISYYAPYYFTPYPASEQYIVDTGTLSEVYIRQGQDYLILTKDDGTKIRLKEFSGFDDLQEHYGVEEFRVKLWWFPLRYSSSGWIAGMEIENNEVFSKREQQSKFNQQVQNFMDFDSILTFFLYALLAVIWEFIIQYKIVKQGEK